jgi:hypothetical protein
MSDDFDDSGIPEDLDERIQEEVDDYVGDVYPELDPENRPQSSGCLLILALPTLLLWFMR